MSKAESYKELVYQRKVCSLCRRLVNPSSIEFDSEEIGPWSRWQHNLDAEILVIGQDWGNVKYYTKNKGMDSDKEMTCKNIIKRFSEIGVDLGTPSCPKEAPVFFTNSILCLKPEGKSSNVLVEWQKNCGRRFLKPLISIIKPKVVIALGEKSYRAVMKLYGKNPELFKDAVDNSSPLVLESGINLFSVYHCSQQVINSGVRTEDQQKNDWKRIQKYLL